MSGDELTFKDMRGRRRTLKIIDIISPTCVKVELQKTAYIQERSFLKNERFQLFVQSVVPIPVQVPVKKGVHIRIYLDETSLDVTKTDPAVKVTTTLPKAFCNVRVGHRLYIDDGKIFALIQKVTNEYVEAEVISTGRKPRAIKEGAGMNLPDSFIHLNVSSLTKQDLESIPFIIKHADIVGLSFVHTPHDVNKLYAILAEHGAQHITVIAKIETGEALHNLAQLLEKEEAHPQKRRQTLTHYMTQYGVIE
ncbi:pyruvate kinase-like protein [Anoxybacillus vitaminiphilus]|uniref:Pyruvate kinase n=1 Tax=Paranoxybacillus vitaminiphilus TaxID=581036 RepID=A0A327YJC9_9BACL|nr:pyruvate kinase [Anoxybacillus vitaminiphilus]RAK19875.1 pyruvate kinase-like protein [Anoxybacillus vitaminiphilus]